MILDATFHVLFAECLQHLHTRSVDRAVLEEPQENGRPQQTLPADFSLRILLRKRAQPVSLHATLDNLCSHSFPADERLGYLEPIPLHVGRV